MKFVLDENLPNSLSTSLQLLGHEVVSIKNTKLKGKTDKEIATFANKQKAILITKDLEFGNLTIYEKGAHYGLLIIRLPYYFSAKQITQNTFQFIKSINTADLINAITILELGKYRTRKL